MSECSVLSPLRLIVVMQEDIEAIRLSLKAAGQKVGPAEVSIRLIREKTRATKAGVRVIHGCTPANQFNTDLCLDAIAVLNRTNIEERSLMIMEQSPLELTPTWRDLELRRRQTRTLSTKPWDGESQQRSKTLAKSFSTRYIAGRRTEGGVIRAKEILSSSHLSRRGAINNNTEAAGIYFDQVIMTRLTEKRGTPY